MVKCYHRVTNEQRKELIRLIHEEGYTIKKASKQTEVPYPNAKSINAIYKVENRTAKRETRFRFKKIDELVHIHRNKLKIDQTNPYEKEPLKGKMYTCGIKRLLKTAQMKDKATGPTE